MVNMDEKTMAENAAVKEAETIQQAMRTLLNDSMKTLGRLFRARAIYGMLLKINAEERGLDEQDVDWDFVNEILAAPANKYDYNILNKVSSMSELEDLCNDIETASIFDDMQPWYRHVCKQCGEEFTMTRSQVAWYEKKGLDLPKRCRYCRKGIARPFTEPEVAPKKVERKAAAETDEETALARAFKAAGWNL